MTAPAGLTYIDSFLDDAEQQRLLGLFEGWEFEELRLHGRPALRTARHFGRSYDLEQRRLGPAPSLPDELGVVRQRAAAVVGLDAARFSEALVLRYPPGAGIGWHRDAPHFGAPVFGVSLGSSCVLRFKRRTRPSGEERWKLTLQPGSAYVLDGAARWSWQHSIGASPGLRYSITFRTVRDAPGDGEPGDAPASVEDAVRPAAAAGTGRARPTEE